MSGVILGEELLFKDKFGDLTQQHESEIPLQFPSDGSMPSLHHCWGSAGLLWLCPFPRQLGHDSDTCTTPLTGGEWKALAFHFGVALILTQS